MEKMVQSSTYRLVCKDSKRVEINLSTSGLAEDRRYWNIACHIDGDSLNTPVQVSNPVSTNRQIDRTHTESDLSFKRNRKKKQIYSS